MTLSTDAIYASFNRRTEQQLATSTRNGLSDRGPRLPLAISVPRLTSQPPPIRYHNVVRHPTLNPTEAVALQTSGPPGFGKSRPAPTLLGIPSELRCKIYQHLVAEGIINRLKSWGWCLDDPQNVTAILQTCRLRFIEALPIFQTHTLVVIDEWSVTSWCKTLKPAMQQQLHQLEIRGGLLCQLRYLALNLGVIEQLWTGFEHLLGGNLMNLEILVLIESDGNLHHGKPLFYETTLREDINESMAIEITLENLDLDKILELDRAFRRNRTFKMIMWFQVFFRLTSLIEPEGLGAWVRASSTTKA